MNILPVSVRAFAAMKNLNFSELVNCDTNERRPLLPNLVRMSILSPQEKCAWLMPIEVVNNIESLLQIDYQELVIDLRKEKQQRYFRITQ